MFFSFHVYWIFVLGKVSLLIVDYTLILILIISQVLQWFSFYILFVTSCFILMFLVLPDN